MIQRKLKSFLIKCSCKNIWLVSDNFGVFFIEKVKRPCKRISEESISCFDHSPYIRFITKKTFLSVVTNHRLIYARSHWIKHLTLYGIGRWLPDDNSRLIWYIAAAWHFAREEEGNNVTVLRPNHLNHSLIKSCKPVSFHLLGCTGCFVFCTLNDTCFLIK